MCMSLITNIVVLYEVPNFFWFALLYYLLYNIEVPAGGRGEGGMVAEGHPAAGRPSDRPEGPSIASSIYYKQYPALLGGIIYNFVQGEGGVPGINGPKKT